LTVKREHKLRVFENTVLRKKFGPKQQEVRGGWRKLSNEALQHLCSSPDVGVLKVFKSKGPKPARMRRV
jgi:hypothetical protein